MAVQAKKINAAATTLSGGAAIGAPPAKVVLSSDVQYNAGRLGVYKLFVGRKAHGWLVRRHSSKGLCIARNSGGSYSVQMDQRELCFM